MEVYLDNAATTKPYKEVADTVYNVMMNHYGNASSPYSIGDDAKHIIEDVREQIAEDINCSPEEIIFTSGACESNSLAINGYLMCNYNVKLYTSKLEHKSMIGFPIMCKVQNAQDGIIHPYILDETLFKNFSYDNDIVSIQYANNEIGTIQDIKALSDVAHKYNDVFHTDATQMYPQNRINVKELGIDMMSVSAQKLHGPKGIGFLYVKNGIRLGSIIHGSQEHGLRGGTYNTPLIAGMGKALELTRKHNSSKKVQELRDRLLYDLMQLDGVTLNGSLIGTQRLVNNINICIDGVSAETLVTMCNLAGVYISAGSACNSYNKEPSYVLKSIGLTDEQAFSSIRITLDEFNTEQDINYAFKVIKSSTERIRQ